MRSGRGTARLVVGLAIVGAMAGACSGSGSSGTDGAAPGGSDGTRVTDDAADAQTDGDGTTLAPGPASAPAADPADLPAVVDGVVSWRPLTIGGGGFVTGVVASPAAAELIVARTDVGGAYRWDAASGRWVQLLTSTAATDGTSLGRAELHVLSVALAPSDADRVYVAVGDDGNPGEGDALARNGMVLVSDDGGRTFTASTQRFFVAGNQRYRTASEQLAVDPTDPDHVLFGTQREGLWQSHDAGASWSQVPLDDVPVGLVGSVTDDQPGVAFVAYDDAEPARAYAGVAGDRIAATSDGGATWTTIRDLDDDVIPRGGVVRAGRLWVSLDTADGSDAELARYDAADDAAGDAEASSGWVDVTPDVDGGGLVFDVDPTDPDRAALTDGGVRDRHLFTTTDGGESWQSHDVRRSAPGVGWIDPDDPDDDGLMFPGRFAFDPFDPGAVWFAEGVGVWHTDDVFGTDTDGEVAWTARLGGIEETVTSSIIVLADGTPIGTVADDQGFRFDVPGAPPDRQLVDDRFASGASVDASGGHPEVVAWVGAESHLAFEPSRSARGAISTDGGRTWTEFDGTEREMYGGEIAVSATDPDVLVWVPTHAESPVAFEDDPVGVYVSTDGGRSWDHQDPPGGADTFHRFFWWFTRRALAADRVDGGFALMSDDERFFTADDPSSGWAQAAHAPPCSEATACHVVGQLQADPLRADVFWASTGNAGLYRSDDLGATVWQRVDGLDEVTAFGFGASDQPDQPDVPSVVAWASGTDPATGDTTWGLWRSGDDGATWQLLSRHPGGSIDDVTTVSGDPTNPARVYVGFTGTGFLMGDVIAA